MRTSSKSIAVLPFVNMSNSIENEYFCDGLTEEIINALAKIKDLSVTSRTSSFYFKNKDVSAKEVREELKVATFIEGSVRTSKNKMRITVQMIDTVDDFHFWSETFDRNPEHVFEIQDEISLFIAEKLREHIGHLEIEDKLVEPIDVPVDIYRDYLKGRYYIMKLDYKNSIKGINILKEVIHKSPNFSSPYLDINLAYVNMGTMGLLPAFEAYEKAQPYLLKALELDPNSSRSQLNLAWIECWQNWNLEKAYEHAKKALEIQQADDIYLTISNFLTVEGKLGAAHNYLDKALQLDPYAAINHHYRGFLYYLQEEYTTAIPYLKKALDLDPKLPFPPIYIGISLLLSGKPNEALSYFGSLEGVSVKDLSKLGGETMCYAKLNETEKCNEGLRKLETYLTTELVDKAFTFLILVNALLGNSEKVIDLVEQAYHNRLPLILLLNPSPILKTVKNHKRFKDIMLKAIPDNVNYKQKRKYKQALLKTNEIKKYSKELEQIMMDYKLYLNPDLSLKDLASYLELPANYASQLLNLGFQKNFSEYVNTFRVNEFKERILQEENKDLTIMAVAYDSGFNSKTVFNTFFKKIEGATPNAYIKSNIKN
ncbi:helix-turn-helix domain-containing protein [Hwangdonia lutea]|uniref:Helix-turn-helix domain-containing protein n=1 Tax=Hwangdonia lutea TaxID=3075823 RepID=A0AA97ELP9_9FLAO|nr:helix-turn-helix domain-containing protein [Hwangdonia sp. SCSIO 19198]WOD43557.1 helix-turn-helix domain-containing protein [Hwangdonia sp. SCSIO 19198]